MEIHKKFMARCLELAQNGLGHTYPNPLVGCVIVKDHKIIGEGWHQKAGTAHAEVNAIQSVKKTEDLKDATLYVNLEPCSHFGKTPPCSDLIIEKGIKKIVIGTVDPNPKVAGKGIKKLMESGARVEVGILEEECEHLNRRFLTFQRKKRPYIILKWAQTLNGFLAPKNQEGGKPFWITNTYSKQKVHQWRSEEEAILVGKNTVLKDNPQLSTRLWEGKNPTRIIIDRKLESLKKEPKAFLFDRQIPTLIFCENPQPDTANLTFKALNFKAPVLSQIMESLYQLNIQSLIVEGGKITLTHFLEENLWDEARVFIGKHSIEDGIEAPKIDGKERASVSTTGDLLFLYKNAAQLNER